MFPGGNGGRCVGLTTLPPSCASTFWNPQGLSRPVMGLFYLYLFSNYYVATGNLTNIFILLRVCVRLREPVWMNQDRITCSHSYSCMVVSPVSCYSSVIQEKGRFEVLKCRRAVWLISETVARSLSRWVVPWSWKSRAISLFPIWAVRPVQSLSACTRVTFNIRELSVKSNKQRTSKVQIHTAGTWSEITFVQRKNYAFEFKTLFC